MQRVALARSLVMQPSMMLLDEPLSNLDARLRDRLRGELRELQQQLGLTSVYVTHDQEEALALADHIAMMQHGRIVQLGTPRRDLPPAQERLDRGLPRRQQHPRGRAGRRHPRQARRLRRRAGGARLRARPAAARVHPRRGRAARRGVHRRQRRHRPHPHARVPRRQRRLPHRAAGGAHSRSPAASPARSARAPAARCSCASRSTPSRCSARRRDASRAMCRRSRQAEPS